MEGSQLLPSLSLIQSSSPVEKLSSIQEHRGSEKVALMSSLACHALSSDVLSLCPKVGALACAAAYKTRVSSVLLVCSMWGAVSRCPVLFKFKGIMAFSVKQ